MSTPRALAVTTATRPVAVPDIPAVADFFPGYEASSWYGVGAPKNAPAEIIDKLNQEIKCRTYCSQDKGTASRPWRNGDCGVAQRFWRVSPLTKPRNGQERSSPPG
jgi:hypothetical protein